MLCPGWQNLMQSEVNLIIQAIIAVLGLEAAAKDAAEVKIPEPMQLPSTIATAAARPSSLFNSRLPGLLTSLILLIYFQHKIVKKIFHFICFVIPESPSAS